MSLWDRVSQFLAIPAMQEAPIRMRTQEDDILNAQIAALRTNLTRPWRMSSIEEALGVPAIQRAVTLVSNTTGSLSIQAFRNGELMTEPPRLIVRPDPYSTPQVFLRDSAYNMATRGEVVWWIASRDIDNLPSALIVVPLSELTVEENPRNRLLPVYRWGKVVSTRYSAANPWGAFVHVTYLKEPGQLRGVGPLQLGKAAISVSVEAQEWAANFYADGGQGGSLIQHAGYLSPDLDEDGLNEADRLRAQWVGKPNNIPRIIDQTIASVEDRGVNTVGAQMLDARQHQTGEAARLYGIPGSLLEYNVSGSSLTYQNVAEVYTQFVRTCLSVNYLEPMEQAFTDLLTRSTTARFYVDGLLRADIKTRFEVYKAAIESQIMTAEYAQMLEGIAPGSIEVAPVPFAPPAAIPSSIPSTRSAPPIRCDGMRVFRGRLQACGKLLAERGPFTGTCPRCRKTYAGA